MKKVKRIAAGMFISMVILGCGGCGRPDFHYTQTIYVGVSYYDPVSYTHLDVYKRQPLSSGLLQQ